MSTSTSQHAVPTPGNGHVYAVIDGDVDETAGLRATIELAPVGIAQFDAAGRFTLVNPRLCTILGYSPEQLLELTFHELTFPDDRDACNAANASLAAGEIPSYQLEKRFIRADGSTVWARVTVSAVRRSTGDVAFFVGVAEDISDQRAHEEARASEQAISEKLLRLEHEARAHAERANRMRDDVLAVVAHDLRNPLHTLQLSALAMAEPTTTDAKRAQQAELIQRVVESMDRLIGELLDIGRIEAGRFPIAKAPARLSDLLDETLTMFMPQARQAGVTLTLEDEAGPVAIMCDHDQIMRVLSNLVGNAIKFTSSQGCVTVRTARTSDAIAITVADNGPGIAPEDLAHVFDRFWQADRTKRFGTGLGLVIAKGIVESHGGSIMAESKVGSGSTFGFTLPGGE